MGFFSHWLRREEAGGHEIVVSPSGGHKQWFRCQTWGSIKQSPTPTALQHQARSHPNLRVTRCLDVSRSVGLFSQSFNKHKVLTLSSSDRGAEEEGRWGMGDRQTGPWHLSVSGDS